jgi:hypothetical protein
MKKVLMGMAVAAMMVGVSNTALADRLSVFDASWTDMTVQGGNNGHPEDYVPGNGQVYPGYGGQPFDAEYFLYKIQGNSLFVGLQTGFNLVDGKQKYDGAWYYSGDLYLSFDNSPSTYEYAVDFQTTGGWGTNSGDEAFKQVTKSSSPTYGESGPYLVTEGSAIAGVLQGISNGSGQYVDTVDDAISGLQTSYWTIVELDLVALFGADWASKGLTLGTHWTMSCGNDAVKGVAQVDPVPEPATMLLFGTGLLGLAGAARRRQVAQ